MADGSRSAHGIAELLLLSSRERFLFVEEGPESTLHILDSRRAWVALTGEKQRVRREVSAIHGVLRELREAQQEEMPAIPAVWLADSAAAVRSSVDDLYMLAHSYDVEQRQIEDLNKQPPGVYLLTDGVLDASTDAFKVLESAELEWCVTDAVVLTLSSEEASKIANLKPDDINQEAKEDVAALWARQPSYTQMIAYRTRVTDKGMDAYMDPISGGGKTATAELSQSALPGLVALIDVSSDTLLSQKWSEINAALSTGRVVILDESANKPISRDVMTELTGPTLKLTRKYEQHHMVPRRATAIAVGPDWPFLPGGAQGIVERIGQVAHGGGAAFPSQPSLRDRLQGNPDARRYHAFKLLHAAVDAKPIQEEGPFQDIQERSTYGPVERFLYSSIEWTGKHADELLVEELNIHPAMSAYGVSARKVQPQLLKAMERLWPGQVGPEKQHKDDKHLIGIWGFKIHWWGV